VSRETCSVPRCRAAAGMTWLGHPVCDAHWARHCEGRIDLHAALGEPRPCLSCGRPEGSRDGCAACAERGVAP
jgi:hypothetical protein